MAKKDQLGKRHILVMRAIARTVVLQISAKTLLHSKYV